MYRLILRPLSTAPELQGLQGASWGSWQNLTLQNNWISESGWFTTPNQVRRAGELIELKLAVKNSSAAIGSVICTLPVEFRPADRCVLVGFSTSSSGTAAGIIAVIPNGEVRLNQSASADAELVIRQTFWRV